MANTEKYQAHQLKQLLSHPAWPVFELFVNNLIISKLQSNVSKEVLIGMKASIDEVKKFVYVHEINEG